MSEEIINDDRKRFLRKPLNYYGTMVLKESYLKIYDIAKQSQMQSENFDELFDSIIDILDEYDEAGFLEEGN